MSEASLVGQKTSSPGGGSNHSLPDTQNSRDPRGVALQKVGIQGIRMPLVMGGWERAVNRTQTVSAVADASVDLVAEQRGIHMSRLVLGLGRLAKPFHFSHLAEALDGLKQAQGASAATLRLAFPYFVERAAPVTGVVGPAAIETDYRGEIRDGKRTLWQSVTAPVKTLCPCSKEISDYGAHNQRGYVTVELRHEFPEQSAAASPEICPEEIVEMIESSGSAPIYPVLKRSDERHVTMQAYDNPAFVEDVARNVVLKLKADGRMHGFKVKVVNHESIHDHAAVAEVEG